MRPSPPSAFNRQRPAANAGDALTLVLNARQQELNPFQSYALSLLTHLGIIVLLVGGYFLLLFLGLLHLDMLTPPDRTKDLEFQLVDQPTQTPRHPTNIRAEHNTRSGGVKTPNQRVAQAEKLAGQPKPTPVHHVAPPTPKPMPQPRPQPAHQAQRPTPKSAPQPAPPAPRMTAPKAPTRPQRIAALPNPLAPVKMAAAPSAVNATGPVVNRPITGSSSASGSGSSGSGRPATLPGQFAPSGGYASNGGVVGEGGHGRFSQSGTAGGGGGRSGVDAQADPDFGPYIAELQRRIRRYWTPPEAQEDKKVVLLFTIARDGRLLKIVTQHSSGYTEADAAAHQAVERSAPFRPLPAGFRENSINVEFTFDYNVLTGRSNGIMRAQ